MEISTKNGLKFILVSQSLEDSLGGLHPSPQYKNEFPQPGRKTEADVPHVVPVSFPVAGLRILSSNVCFPLAGLQLVVFDHWLELAEPQVAGFFHRGRCVVDFRHGFGIISFSYYALFLLSFLWMYALILQHKFMPNFCT